MKLKEIISRIINKYLVSIKRFILAFSFSLILALDLTIQIIDNNILSDFNGADVIALCFGIILAVLAQLLYEVKEIKLKKVYSYLIVIVLTIACFYIANTFYDEIYVFMAIIGICLGLLCLIAYLLYTLFNQDQLFSYYISSLFFVSIVCAVVMGGCSLCLAAFQLLIYDPKNFENAYFILFTITNIVLGFNLLLSFVPTKEGEMKVPKAYSTIANKIGLAIYLLLLVILYGYFIKVILTFKLPKGEINWFSSFALLFFCFFYLSIRNEEDKFSNWFNKYAGFLMLPIIIIQAVAISIRVSSYGLTAMRYISILLNIIGIMFVLDSILFKKIKWVFIGMACIALIVTITPLNVLDVPIYWQKAIITKTLTNNNMLIGNKITHNDSISEEDQNKIISAYNYLEDYKRYMKEEDKFIFTDNFDVLYGFPHHREAQQYDYVSLQYYTNLKKFDISGYQSFESFSSNNHDSDKIVATSDEIDVTDYLLSYYYDKKLTSAEIPLMYKTDNKVIYFTNVEITLNTNKKIVSYYIYGYLVK